MYDRETVTSTPIQQNGHWLVGVIGWHVDDSVSGGHGKKYEKAIADLRKTFPFKHWKSRKGRFCGSELNRNFDFSITASQKEFSDQLSYAKSRNRAKPEDAASHDEIREFMGLNGSSNWWSKESRPYLACQTNQNQQCLPNPTVGQIRNANALSEGQSNSVISPSPINRFQLVI